MSYILDALKKSEQERSRGEVPSIKSLHNQPVPSQQKRRVWPYVLLVVLVLNVAVAVYILQRESKDITVASTPIAANEVNEKADTQALQPQMSAVPLQEPRQQLKQNNQQPQSAPNLRQKPKAEPEHASVKPDNVVYATSPLNVTDAELRAAKTANREKVGSVTFSGKADIVDAADLPEDIRAQVPAIRFEGHVYSSVPKQRSVMINGNKMREGQNISNELVLERITVEGAVFLFRGYMFKLGALQDWNAR